MKNKKEYTWYNVSKDATKLLVIGILIFMAFIFGKAYSKYELQNKIDNAIIKCDMLTDSIYDKTILSWENIDFWICYFKLRHPDIIKAQIIQECGYDLTSKICIENNNLFGMKLPYKRVTTALYQNRGHAGFSTYIECIKDMKMFQDAYYDTMKTYYSFLQRYAQDSNYVKKVFKLTKNPVIR